VHMYFPENYMWSISFLRCLNSGGLLGEMDRAGRELIEASRKLPSGDLESWHVRWDMLAEQVEEMAKKALDDGQKVTARDSYYRAAHYYQWAEAFLPMSDSRKKLVYHKHLDCFREATELMSHSIEIIDVPYVAGPLPAYFIPAVAGTPRPGPPVIFFGGLDSVKEELFYGGRMLVERGMSCLVVDGPGQGEALKLRGIISRTDYEVPAAAVYEYLASRPEVDSKRVGIMGISLGGYYAPRAAAFEKRFKACVAWGAIYDWHESWLRRLNIAPATSIASPAHHLFNVLGVENWEQALERLKTYSLRGIAKQITCDFLIVHGEDDKHIPLVDAQALYNEAGSKWKELKVYTHVEGGAEHCQIDCPVPALSFIADWLAKHL
jgi:dienelactone hydrolase